MFTNAQAFDFSAFSAPIQQIAELNTAIFNKAFSAQQAAAQNLLTLSQARATAAMEINDVEGFVAFVSEQSDIAKSSTQELVESTLVGAKEAEAYFAQIQAIVSKSQETAVKTAPAALKSVAKKAASEKTA